MNKNAAPLNLKHREITEKILHAFFKRVYQVLGYGFLEAVYHNAMVIALREEGLVVESEVPIQVYFEDHLVGEYFADLIVEDKILVELKATEAIHPQHEAQLLNYLRATPYEVGLLLNFGKTAEFRRLVFDNERKPSITWNRGLKNRTKPQ